MKENKHSSYSYEGHIYLKVGWVFRNFLLVGETFDPVYKAPPPLPHFEILIVLTNHYFFCSTKGALCVSVLGGIYREEGHPGLL